ncbi:hypothetical protein CIB48_g9966 [Xylaria polymorpha]|nr:hypothetical protein CIB48_g9966 [Xylaria polymorpha]
MVRSSWEMVGNTSSNKIPIKALMAAHLHPSGIELFGSSRFGSFKFLNLFQEVILNGPPFSIGNENPFAGTLEPEGRENSVGPRDTVHSCVGKCAEGHAPSPVPRNNSFGLGLNLRQNQSKPDPDDSSEAINETAHHQFHPKLCVYHAGTGRITFLACLKLSTLFIFAFFGFVVTPAYYKKEGLSPTVVRMFVAYTTSPFVTFIHMRLPPFARQSEEMLRRYVRTLSPQTELDITTMSLIAKPRVSVVKLSDLAPVSRRFGIVNMARDTAVDNAKRRWYMFPAVASTGQRIQTSTSSPHYCSQENTVEHPGLLEWEITGFNDDDVAAEDNVVAREDNTEPNDGDVESNADEEEDEEEEVDGDVESNADEEEVEGDAESNAEEEEVEGDAESNTDEEEDEEEEVEGDRPATHYDRVKTPWPFCHLAECNSRHPLWPIVQVAIGIATCACFPRSLTLAGIKLSNDNDCDSLGGDRENTRLSTELGGPNSSSLSSVTAHSSSKSRIGKLDVATDITLSLLSKSQSELPLALVLPLPRGVGPPSALP